MRHSVYIHTQLDLGYVSPRSGCQDYSSRFQRCALHTDSPLQHSGCGSSSAVLGDAVMLLMLINDVIVPSSMMMWLISSFYVVSLCQLMRFCRLQCLIKPNETAASLFRVLSLCSPCDHKSANNDMRHVCLQLLAVDCLAQPLRILDSAVCQRQPIFDSSCVDWHTLKYTWS